MYTRVCLAWNNRRKPVTLSATRFTEIPWQEGAHHMDGCAYLFATEIREIEELTLGLTITEARPQASITTVDEQDTLGFLKIGGRPIQEDETCRVFQVVFDPNYLISYTVLNETYGKYPEPPEAFTGKYFRVFSRSHLLDFTERTTYASGGHPATLMHFEIACLNHVIDVICTAPPKISIGRQVSA